MFWWSNQYLCKMQGVFINSDKIMAWLPSVCLFWYWKMEHRTSNIDHINCSISFRWILKKKNVSNACLHVLKWIFFLYMLGHVAHMYIYSVFSYMWWRVRVRYFVTEIILGERRGTEKYSTMRKCILYPHKHISYISRDEKSINTNLFSAHQPRCPLSCQRICSNFHSTINSNSLSFII